MTDFTIDDRALQAALDRVLKSLRDLRPLFKDIGEEGINRVDSYFERQTAPDGSKWRPLSRATLIQKQRQRKRLAILQRNGILKRSIVYRATSTSVTIGTNVEYAPYHQIGTRTIEARPYLSLGEDREFVRDITELIEEYLVHAWEG